MKRVVGGAVRVQGYDPRKLRTLDQAAPAARPRSRARIPIAHILWLQARRVPRSPAPTWKYLEPKDWLNLKLTGRVRGDVRLDRAALGHRQPRPRAHRLRPRSAAHVRPRPRAAARSRARDRRCSGRCRPRSADATSVCPPGIPVVGGTPDLQSAAIGSGAVRDFEGHLYVGTSSWLTCHVPFKKTDLLPRHRVAAVAAARQVLRRRRAGGRGRVPRTGCATTCSSPTTRCARRRARRLLRPPRRRSPPAPRRAATA